MESLNPEHVLYFAPPLKWFIPLMESNKLTVLNESVFTTKSYRNRIDFTGINGRQSFSIPLLGESRKKDYKSVEISYSENWQNHLVNALQTAYGKSPFYEYYDYKVEAVLLKHHRFLWDLNLEVLELCLNMLKHTMLLQVKDIKGSVQANEIETNRIEYYQVFSDKTGFIENLSIFDLVFNEGMDSGMILQKMKK